MIPDYWNVKKLTVTIIQTSSAADAERSLARVDELLAQTPPSDLIALPEVLAVRGSSADYRRLAEPVPGPTAEHLAAAAADRGSWLLAGSIVERSGEETYNTSILFNRAGNIAATYRKIHLFEARLEDGAVVRESDSYAPGTEPTLADLEGWICGMSICYDIRFPELYRRYADRGSHILFVPADFTQNTGKDHWELLLRARAVENQCFVVAPNQCGANEKTEVVSYGHSMVVGPWGDVLCRAGDRDAVLTAELDPETLSNVRARIPVLRHRKLTP